METHMKKRSIITAGALASLFLTGSAGLVLADGWGEHSRRDRGHDRQEHAMMMFGMMDEDGDKAVSEKEIADFRADMARRLDTDKNGILSANEMQKQKDVAREMMRERRLARYDANRDGKVSVEEFANARTPFFDRMDRNEDGKIERNEMYRKYRYDD